MVAWEVLHIAEKRSERQKRKEKMYPTECSIPEDRKEREESLKVNQAEK